MLDTIKELLFPQDRCLLCGKKGVAGGICPECRQRPWQKRYHVCRSCAAFVPLDMEYCGNCWEGAHFYFDMVKSYAPYEGILRQHILDLKYHGRRGLARLFGSMLAEFVVKEYAGIRIDALIPVPMYAKKQKERGYNQVMLITREVANILCIPVIEGAIIRSKETKLQAGLNRRERFANLCDAIVAGNADVTGKHLLLLDDIFTTGATASACSFALKKAGAAKIYVATCAATIWHER